MTLRKLCSHASLLIGLAVLTMGWLSGSAEEARSQQRRRLVRGRFSRISPFSPSGG
jgi:hypothetical protein